MTIRLATRGSPQATTQSQLVADQLNQAGFEAELVLIDTVGDRTQSANVPLHSIGGQGVFTKEVQYAVLSGHADLAVHSAKDLPSTPHDGLTLAAFMERRSACDALVGCALDDLAFGATIATGSVRRRAQLHRARPDLRLVELRGNIHTRLDKIPDGGAIVIAVAALEVLSLTERISDLLDPAEFVPAVGQGCVAIECREGDDQLIGALAALDHAATRRAVMIERAYLAELGSGCSLPVGAYAVRDKLHTFLFDAGTGITVSETIDLTGALAADLLLAREAAMSAHSTVTRA